MTIDWFIVVQFELLIVMGIIALMHKDKINLRIKVDNIEKEMGE